jgi:hypothetical protein
MSSKDRLELKSFEDVVRDYFADGGAKGSGEMEWFGCRPTTLTAAIERACLSRMPAGKGKGGRQVRHPHQRRIPEATLREASHRLAVITNEVQSCRDFLNLHSLVKATISPIRGIGKLAIYDFSHRIGVFLGTEPTTVYLHRGARKGARALGLKTKRESIPINEFPKAFLRLTAAQIEDVLCIYRVTLARLYRAKSLGRIGDTQH